MYIFLLLSLVYTTQYIYVQTEKHQIMMIATNLIYRALIFIVPNILKEFSVVYQRCLNRFIGVKSHTKEQLVKVSIY